MSTKNKSPKIEGMTSKQWYDIIVQLRAHAKAIDSQKNEAIAVYLYKTYHIKWPTWAIEEARRQANV